MRRNLAHTVIGLMILCTGVVSAEPPARTAPPVGKSRVRRAPTFVLVHGAWADGSSWDRVVPLLAQRGTVISVHLPLTSVADDVATVRRVIDEQPGDVVLVGHSYGGFVISEAGNSDKVKSLVYVDAFVLDDGESLNSITKGKPLPWTKTLKVDRGGFAWLPPETVARVFAPDLPVAEQTLITAKQGPLPLKNFDEKMQNPVWKKKTSFYVLGTADAIIPPDAQEMMATRAKSTVTKVDSGHLAMLVKPDEVAAVILNAMPTQATARK